MAAVTSIVEFVLVLNVFIKGVFGVHRWNEIPRDLASHRLHIWHSIRLYRHSN